MLFRSDGMGGHSCGEVASDIAVNYSAYVIDQNFNKNMNDQEILKLLDDAVEAANIQVELEGRYNPAKQGMGTTLSIALIINNNLYIAHVGDSRIYLLDKHKLKQLTKDDTYVQSLVDRGELRPSEARNHPQHSVLLKAVGSSEPVYPQLKKYRLKSGDKLLLCSDGLYDALTAEEIRNIMFRARNPEECVDNLVNQSINKGAPDNVTVIVGFI